MLGVCGSETCEDTGATEESNPPSTNTLDCPADSCEECISQGCGWVPLLGSCRRSCNTIADIPCSSPSDGVDVCAVDETTAIEAPLIDGTPQATSSCNDSTSCQGCLTSGCAWNENRGCAESCDVTGTCLQSMDDMDSCIPTEDSTRSVCATQLDCNSCLGSVSIGDSNDACVWYPDEARCLAESEVCDTCGPSLNDTCFTSSAPTPKINWTILVLLVSVAGATMW